MTKMLTHLMQTSDILNLKTPSLIISHYKLNTNNLPSIFSTENSTLTLPLYYDLTKKLSNQIINLRVKLFFKFEYIPKKVYSK